MNQCCFTKNVPPVLAPYYYPVAPLERNTDQSLNAAASSCTVCTTAQVGACIRRRCLSALSNAFVTFFIFYFIPWRCLIKYKWKCTGEPVHNL